MNGRGSPAAPADSEAAEAAAEHIAAIARALGTMGSEASITSQQRVTAGEADTIVRFLPDLARRYGIDVEYERSGALLTVTLSRTVPCARPPRPSSARGR